MLSLWSCFKPPKQGQIANPIWDAPPHLKVIEAPPQKDLKLVLCYVGIYMQKFGKHLGEHPIPIMSSFHRQSLSPGQISAKFHSFPQKWPFTMGIEEIPRFFVDLSVGLMWHVIQNTTTHKSKKIENMKPCQKHAKSIKTSLTWNLLLIFLAFERGHLGSIVRISWSIASFVWGTRDPKRPLMQRLAIQVQRSENGCYKCIILRSLRSFKRHYRTNTQTHIINKQSEVPCGTRKCDSSVFEWHQYLPSFKIVNGYRNRRMILVCHRKFSPKSSHLIFPTKPPGRGRIH